MTTQIRMMTVMMVIYSRRPRTNTHHNRNCQCHRQCYRKSRQRIRILTWTWWAATNPSTVPMTPFAYRVVDDLVATLTWRFHRVHTQVRRRHAFTTATERHTARSPDRFLSPSSWRIQTRKYRPTDSLRLGTSLSFFGSQEMQV